jgi:hypothetical protein
MTAEISNQHGRHMSARGSARGRVLAAAVLGLLLLALTSTCASASRTLNISDKGSLRFVRASGSLLLDEGRVSGTFPGSVKVRFLYNGEPNVSARFTITASAGSISARATGRLSSPTSPAPSFRGRMTVTGGTGRFQHIHGGGELFGVFNRRSYALTVQAVGKLPY